MPEQTITKMKYEAFRSLMDDYISRLNKLIKRDDL